MLMRRLILVLGALLLAVPVTADAQSARVQILRDCQDGSVDGNYTLAQIRDARQSLSTDGAEYTGCVDALREAELAAARDPAPTPTPTPTDSGGSGGGQPSDPIPTPTPGLVPETDGDRDALARAADAGEQPVTVGGENLLAGVTPLSGAGNPLPAPVVVALIGLGLAGLALALPSLRRRATALLRHR